MACEVNFEDIKLEGLPEFSSLIYLQQQGATDALSSLRRVTETGILDLTMVRRIADFGAGIGGPTFTLVTIARLIGAEVDALEKPSIGRFIPGFLRDEHIHFGDGTVYLNSLDERGIPKYDLVTAFMLGPDEAEDLFRDLAQACGRGLNPNGNLFVTSDSTTLFWAVAVCEGSRVKYSFLRGVPDILVLPQTSCERINGNLDILKALQVVPVNLK